MVFPILSRYGTQVSATGVLFLFYIQACAAQMQQGGGPGANQGANNGPNDAPTTPTANNAPTTSNDAKNASTTSSADTLTSSLTSSSPTSSSHTSSSSALVSSAAASSTSQNKSFLKIVGIGGMIGIILGAVIVAALILLLLAAFRQRWRRARKKPHGVVLSALPNSFTKSSQESTTQTRPLISGPTLLSPPSFMSPRFPRKGESQDDTKSLSSSRTSPGPVVAVSVTTYKDIRLEVPRSPIQRQNSPADSASVYSSDTLQSPYESTLALVNEDSDNLNARISAFYQNDSWSAIPPSHQSSSLSLMTAHQKALEAELEDGSSLLVAPPGYSPV
jgi:hypothetical protein